VKSTHCGWPGVRSYRRENGGKGTMSRLVFYRMLLNGTASKEWEPTTERESSHRRKKAAQKKGGWGGGRLKIIVRHRQERPAPG